MLDIFALTYFALSTLSLLHLFPIEIYEFLDMREGYAISDYALSLEISSYFNISAIITGLLCGLDAITNPVYKKLSKNLYNYHSLFSFSLVGIGLFPLTGEWGWPVSRIGHWFFTFCFMVLFPLTRLLVLRHFNTKVFKILLAVFLGLGTLACIMVLFFDVWTLAYPEYLIALALYISLIFSKVAILRKESS